MSFYLYTGTKLESLAELYCKKIYSGELTDPMTEETVVIQTQGIASFLRQYIAKSCGIAANLQMPFINSFAEKLILANVSGTTKTANGQTLDHYQQWKNFSLQSLQVNICKMLCREPQDFPELARYISGENSELKRWQLAARVAGLFDRYQLYRYAAGQTPLRGKDWQSRLWHKLIREYGNPREFYYRQILTRTGSGKLRGLPRRIAVFGIGSLPPFYLELFMALSQTCEVHFFYITPCREDWEFLYSKSERKYLDLSDEEFVAGNELLASWGKCGRELFSFLYSQIDRIECHQEDDVIEDFTDPESGSGTALQLLQQDILSSENNIHSVAQTDDSIEIFNCHSARRQLEVLHEKLLQKFAGKEFSPHEVIVMAPDINEFAPLIETVFSAGPLKNSYTIADRTLQGSGSISEAFYQLLNSGVSRVTVNEILSLLSLAPVAAKLNLSTSDTGFLRELIQKSNIRWGFDAEDHEKCCGKAFAEYSWYHSFDRILENFAVGSPAQIIPGTTPELEESELETFGALIGFVSELKELRAKLSHSRTLRQWSKFSLEILDKFFLPLTKEEKHEFNNIRIYLSELSQLAFECDFTEPLPVNVLLDIVSSFLNTAINRFSFLRGKITFCSLTPLRSIPAKAIAVLGMENGKFPRKDHQLNFNLMTPMPGDKSAIAEDRYLFLEAVMSARKNFWCFYNGQSRQTDKEQPPCPILDELIQHLDKYFAIQPVMQPLMPFAAEYFTENSAVRSFSETNYDIAFALMKNRFLSGLPGAGAQRPAFSGVALPKNDTPGKRFLLFDIISWAQNPASYFFRKQMDVRLSEVTKFPDEEPVSMEKWEMFDLGDTLLKMQQENISDAECQRRFLHANMLPVGNAGNLILKQLANVLESLPEDIKKGYYSQSASAVSFEVNGNMVSGTINKSENGHRQYFLNFQTKSHRHHVNALISHCAMCMSGPFLGNAETFLYEYNKTKGSWECTTLFSNIWMAPEVQDFWKTLLDDFISGQTQVPRLFPKALFTYKNRGNYDAARNKFIPASFMGKGDLDNGYIKKLFSIDDWDDPRTFKALEHFDDLFYKRIAWKPKKK